MVTHAKEQWKYLSSAEIATLDDDKGKRLLNKMREVYNELESNQTDLPPEYAKVLIEDFWDLI